MKQLAIWALFLLAGGLFVLFYVLVYFLPVLEVSLWGTPWKVIIGKTAWVLAFFTLWGCSFSFWGILSIYRFFYEKFTQSSPKAMTSFPQKGHSISMKQVAVIVPAHNEEVTIRGTVESLKNILPPAQIFIGSDASTDSTVAIASSMGCQVADIQPNRGKAGVIKFMLDHFLLLDRFKAVMIVDADTQIDFHYLERALPLFDDPEIVAVAGHARTRWQNHCVPRWPMFFVAYRMRLYRVLQAIFRYSQTGKLLNVSPIVPGFASVYRSSALRHIDIVAPGLVIEDFNMTFEIHRKHLGRIAYHPSIFATCQDPHRLGDYLKQVKRWNMGFWQTVKRHGVWPGLFWLSLTFFLLEVTLSSFLFVLIPLFFLLWVFLHSFSPILLVPPDFLHFFVLVNPADLFIGVFLADYLLTIVIAIVERKPLLLFYGIGFTLLRFIDSLNYLFTTPLAFLTTSTGTWQSPQRKVEKPL